MDAYNKQASEFIFRENNAPGRVDADCVDLHGQYVEEAERILEERIRAEKRSGSSHLHVIVGRGNHSAGHVQKIKPRVEEVCRELGLQCHTEENEGRMYIDLGGEGGGRPHGQPEHGRPDQGQGEHGRPDHGGKKPDEEDAGVCGSLLRCCVVM